MKLKFHTSAPHAIDLRPNSSKRDWMDATGQSFAYRCLPLVVANAHGWSFHLTHGFKARWTGSNALNGIQFIAEDQQSVASIVTSAFGSGILTFHIHGVFQTEPGWNILTSGPVNAPKDAIAPLTGIIETDWAPYSFTMNWKFTRPDTWVEFKKGDVFCSVYPVKRNQLEAFEPEIVPMSDDPVLAKDHAEWAASRSKFLGDLKQPDSEASAEKWQKAYYRGKRPDGSDGVEDHVIKMRLKPFSEDER
jgi:hypothetical protein